MHTLHSNGGIYGFRGEVIAKRLFHPRIFANKMWVENFKRGEGGRLLTRGLMSARRAAFQMFVYGGRNNSAAPVIRKILFAELTDLRPVPRILSLFRMAHSEEISRNSRSPVRSLRTNVPYFRPTSKVQTKFYLHLSDPG